MIRLIDRFLDGITMYRLALYYLVALVVAALVLGLFNIIPHDPIAIAFSTAVIVATCWTANLVFSRVYEAPANSESVYITALILALILEPVAVSDLTGIGVLIFASVWATASKFVFAMGRKHIFNPAAFGAALPAFLLGQPATWWVGGNLGLLPVVLLGGLLVVRKLRRFDLVLVFILVDLATVLLTTTPSQYRLALTETLLYSPLFFFAFIMLTEPLTAPTMRLPRLAFGALVGVLFVPNIHFGTVYLTPELALLIGNVFAFLVSPKGRYLMTLERIEQAAADTYDFVFRPHQKMAFQAGQYLEWTLPLDESDSRGNRRYFTLASAPTESAVRLGVKFYPDSSAFKRGLGALEPGETIHASQLAGSFTLPADPDTKLAFLAGGIGITPFRSMLQYLLDQGETRPIIMLYGNERRQDIAYRDVIEAADRELGIRTVHALAKGARRGEYPGYIDARLVRAVIPDYRERIFYISGPQAMVSALRKMLRAMGVRRSQIKTDFFPGFA
jgi:ferredoxin-NADP reductase/Na+-translocating ferredoxin:NAD+ oxidoreductase RnfD subunit